MGETLTAKTSALHAQLFPKIKTAPVMVAAILDGAKVPALFSELNGHPFGWYILHTGNMTEELRHVLPYLVFLDAKSPFTFFLLKKFGTRCEIFLQLSEKFFKNSTAATMSLAAHLIKNLHVALPQNEIAWFRYYDPEILKDFWEISTDTQKKCLTGDFIDGFWVESPESASFVCLNTRADSTVCTGGHNPISISAGQLEALDAMQHQRFLNELTQHIHHSGLTDHSATLYLNVEHSVKEAELSGLQDPEDITQYVILDAENAWKMSHSEAAQGIMRNSDHSPAMRLQQLVEKYSDKKE